MSTREAFVLGLGAITVPVSLVLGNWYPLLAGPLPLAGIGGTFFLAYRWRLMDSPRFVQWWLVLSVGMALGSIMTGLGNGLTDEPYATPAFLSKWPNLYSGTLTLTYGQYGMPALPKTWNYVYLPLMVWYQVPGVTDGLGYQYLMLGTWAALLYLNRANRASLVLLASPWVGLLAANGFNDFVPFLFMSLAFVTLSGWSARVTRYVALGLKQFANVLIVGYYLLVCDWRHATEACIVTALILVPFVLLDPTGFWCGAITGCSPGTKYDVGWAILAHANYCLWPTFAVATFGPILRPKRRHHK